MSYEKLQDNDRDRDERIAELVDDYLRRLREGDELSPEEFAGEHADYESDLLEVLPAMRALSDLGARDPAEVLRPGAEGIEGWRLGDFTLKREIGRGGMGVVYEAWQGSMNRRVALKVLPTGAAADSKCWTRFLREAQFMGKLNHPNVVHVHSMGVEERTPYYSMEFVEGALTLRGLPEFRVVLPTPEPP